MVVTIDNGGIISDLSFCPRPDRLCGVEYYNGILIPAMINAHCHLELSWMKGRLAPGGGLAAFAQGIAAERQKLCHSADSMRSISSSIDYWNAKMYSDGVGLVADTCNNNVTFATKLGSAIRYHSFVELFGFAPGGEERAAALMAEARGNTLAASTTPHSAYSLNDSRFKCAVEDFSDRKTGCEATAVDGRTDSGCRRSPLSIHFMESEQERQLFENKGELWEWYRRAGFDLDFAGRYASPAERVLHLAPKERRIMLIHNTFIEEDELAALASHYGENLTMTLCPCSNLHITGTLPPVEMIMRSGVRIAVGTDSLASNRELSLVDELKLFPQVSLTELLRWATLSGAEAMGLQDEYGLIDVGRPARITLLEGIDFTHMSLRPDATTRRIA